MKRMLPALVAFAFLVCGCTEPEPKKDGKKIPGNDEVKKDDKSATTDGKNPVVVMKVKDFGTVKIELFADKSPITVKNFLQYVDDKHYDGTIFHRVMPDFMIQGGHFTKGFAKATSHQEGEKLGKETRGNIKNEASNGVSNARGTLAMARQDAPDTASDQFFINVADNTNKLDPGKFSEDGYAVFGKVIEGMDVVDKIKNVKTMKKAPSGHGAVPIEEVVIDSIRREGGK